MDARTQERSLATRLVRALVLLVSLSPCLLIWLGGCTTLSQYLHNGLKVGPNYTPPPAPIASDWIDPDDRRRDPEDLATWWKTFNDPVLDDLIASATQQNLTLREAGMRILQARAAVGIAAGQLLPQEQINFMGYDRVGLSQATAGGIIGGGNRPRFFSQFNHGFALAWELDFWGRYRRSIEAARADLDASVADYNDVLITLLSDVAVNYVQIRTIEKRIEYARLNVEIQQKTMTKAQARLKVDKNGALALDQSITLLKQTEAGIPELEISLRQANNRLCTLLGIPPEDLRAKLKAMPIPTAAPEIAIGIPADLLRRRPDLRRAERFAAAQSARIGVAQADWYPQVSIVGSFGYSAEHITDVFKSAAFNGTIGPSVRWNILHYGRILNNVRLQDARFQELALAYQNKVLVAQQEVENGLVTFLKAHQRVKLQTESVEAAKKAEKIASTVWQVSGVDFTTVSLIQQNMVQQQDTLAQAQGEIALGLIQLYRALGGGWQVNGDGCGPASRHHRHETPPVRAEFGRPF